ncbi:MAG: InlB B-repeat-containing protein, partial [Faecousia sp.]
PDPTEPDPTEPEPTEPQPTEPEVFYTVTFEGENGYAKYQGEKVTQIQVSSREPYVEFGIHGEYDNGYETDTVTASAGVLDRAGETFILSGFAGDVTVNFTTRFRTVYIDYVISPNWNNNYVVTPQAVTWGTAPARPTVNRTGYHVTDWFYDGEYTQVFDFSQPLTENVTLYGQWERNVYTVTFMVDGEVYSVQQVQHGYHATAISNPTKDDWVFNGWYYDEECTQPFNRASDYFYEDTTLYAGWVEAKLNYVYLDGSAGSDENSGATSSDAVKTFAKAKELLAESAYKEIRIVGQVKVSDTQVWDLSEYPEAVVRRDQSFDRYLFWIDATGNLTLRNITFDGGSKYWASEDGTPFEGYMFFNCTSGYITLDEGAELRNSIYNGTAGVAYINGGHVIINEGASIHDNQGNLTGVFETTASSGAPEITMNGGEIYNNIAVKAVSSGTTSSMSAGVMKLTGSYSKGYCALFTMNGGKIYNNRLTTEDPSYGSGVIFMYNGAKFVMNGGEIFGNGGMDSAVVHSVGASKLVNTIELNGGSIHDNTARDSDVNVHLRTYTDVIINNETVMEGTYWLQNNANTLPITVTAPLTKDIKLTCEAVVYKRILVQGTETYQLTEGDLSHIHLSNEIPEAYKLTLDTENNNIYLGSTQNIGTVIYMASNGSDTNDGLTKETAVATFAKAKELLQKNQSATGDNIIYVVGGTLVSSPAAINITGDETWSLKGIPNAYMQMDPDSKSYMFYVTGTLTLEDIVIDGNCWYNANTSVNIFRVDKEKDTEKEDSELHRGVLNLKSGAVLQNTADEAIYCYGGTVNMYDGAVIRGAQKDGGIYATGSLLASGVDNTPTVNIFGGEITDCYRAFYILGDCTLNIYGGDFHHNGGTNSPGGAVIYANAKNTVTNIYGGSFRDNELTGTAATCIGTVFYTTSACKLNLYGGTFTGNTCAVNPNANGFALNCSSAANNATVTVKAGENGLDLSNAPFYWAFNDDTSSVILDSALTNPLKLTFKTEPVAGQIVLKGTDSYKLTTADLSKVSCLNEGITLKLDTEKNAIVVG